MVDDEKSTLGAAEQAAMSHAWDCFVFHAQQRQTVFNFFLILVAAGIAAYGGTLAKPEGSHDLFHAVVGLLVAVSSFLFWRLDRRNSRLVKLAEAPLKSFEERLSERTRIDVKILVKADDKNEGGYLSKFETFSQIYGVVFVLSGVSGLLAFGISLLRLGL